MRHALLAPLLFTIACGGAPPPEAHATHDHCSGDRLPHPSFTPERYARMLESERRPGWQVPERVLQELGIEPGERVAEVGTGSGFWLPYLDAAVRPGGRVLGEDIDQGLLDIASEKVRERELSSVELHLGGGDDPELEAGAFDYVLLVDTYHHLCDRVGFLRHLRRALAPGGRLVVIDFRDEQRIPVAGSRHRIVRDAVIAEAARAGLRLAREHSFLRYQFMLEFGADDD
jgi:ubiquinone/menaquinone biosynthesis C-methylase UbiE